MAKVYSAELKIAKKANINYKKILGEKDEHKRSNMKIDETKDSVTISIETQDLTALRASINSIARDIQIIENTSKA